MIGRTLAHYRIDRRLGAGGMGEVFAARDLALDRDVAVKVIRRDLADAQLRERFWREARAAAQINHPNVGHLYEIREAAGELFLVMELLEGETLADRIARGPLPAAEAVRLALEVLAALAALHGRGLVHRDVKPTNIFLLADGRVKLLDFGLVLPLSPAEGPALTVAGMVMGSPRYMSPEQVRGTAVDGRADLFALALVLHEALTGRPVFHQADPVEVMHAVLHQQPAGLGGTPELEAIGRVLAAALQGRPEDRPASATVMAEGLRATLAPHATPSRGVPVERVVRLAVVPFRMLRPDPALDFLGPSLADAVAMSLADIRSLVVRSPVAAGRFAVPAPDLDELARTLDVNAALFGSVLVAGERCRVTAQLVEAPGGRVLWSETQEASGSDIFEIQDQLTRRIVDSLQLPLSMRERDGLGRDVPGNATAYEFFLRAGRHHVISPDLVVARDLYLEAVEADPGYAPAWARLARCYRVLGKYGIEGDLDANYRKCSEALDRALTLHPDLPSAVHIAAHFELDRGETAAAFQRLIALVQRNPNDPQGWSGLVAAFRYAGMLEESVAAQARARALDPVIVTSFVHTLDALGEYDRAVVEPNTAFTVDRARLLLLAGRPDEARVVLDAVRTDNPFMISWVRLIEAVLRRDPALARQAALEDYSDSEGLCIVARCRIAAGDREAGLAMLRNAFERGYANAPLLRRDPWLDDVRDSAAFQAIVELAEASHHAAVAAYRGRVPGLVRA